MRDKHVWSGCVAVATAAMVANAAGTRFIMEAAQADGSWTSTIVVAPGTPVITRLRVEFVGSESVTGLAGFNTQFTISNWGAGDELGAWEVPSTSVVGVAVGVIPRLGVLANGRLMPFAASSPLSLPQSSLSGSVMTISGSTANRLPIGQGPSALAGFYFNGALDPQVFQMTFTPSFRSATEHLVTPFNIFNTTANNARWYTGSGSTSINAPSIEIIPLRVSVPATGNAVLIGAGTLVAMRRRRH